ncbi:MAG: transglutaminase domain-containing protein [Candidatus Scalindua sp.]
MMTKGLKTITSLNCIYIMLSLFDLSYAFGNDLPDPSSPVPTRSEVVRSDRSGLADRQLLSERLDRTDKSVMAGITYTTKYFRADNFSKPVYKPVPDECPYPDNSGKLLDDFMYKDWCEETFNNGKYIYEAYKDIAFNMKYTPEQPKTDIWQTPYETSKSKKGDCEDAVLLFASHLSSMQKNTKIIWGWVIDKGSKIARAHVWSQLTDRAGQQYIVECFSKDWDGIIPLGIVEKTELRKPIFTIAHTEFCRLSSLVSEPDSWQTYQSLIDLCTSANFIEFYSRHLDISQGRDSYFDPDYGFIGYILDTQNKSYKDTISHRHPIRPNMFPSLDKEVSSILKKLYELFVRYERQREDFESSMQVAYGSLININSKRNLNCRR